MRVSSSKRPQRRAASALPIIFVTLLALNFVIFVVNVWVFLPKPADKSISVPIRQKKPHQPDPSAQKKPHRPDPSAEALREAIYNSRDKVIPYDAVPKILHQSDSFYGVVPHLPSIPARRRMIPNTTPQNGDPYVPLDAVNNLDYFLGSREKEIEEHQPLYLYNPMLYHWMIKFLTAQYLMVYRLIKIMLPTLVSTACQILPIATALGWECQRRIQTFWDSHCLIKN
ncbi:hypothetical protein QTG54_000391 [Skeletonema marinoi]|uniref:Uncharacterized protein n=1 Tax=Skeletonema marinoi TaxID=267567 RepID=A0AAD9DII2_9STRA|nr:hypothetical protein QTG54_000391 [Skeletonema marinoi]